MPISTPNIVPIADRLTGEARRRFVAAIKKLQKDTSAKGILRAVELGDVASVQSAIKHAKLAAHLEPVIGTMNAALVAAGKVTVNNIGLSIRFDIKNPFAAQAAIQHRARLVRDVSKTTQKAISNFVRRALDEGIPPRELANLIRPTIGLTNNQAISALNLRKTMLKSGASKEATSKAVGRWIDKKLRERAENIARTELIRASNVGQHAAWQDAINNGLIRTTGEPREWMAAESERTCPICEGLDGEIVGFTESFSIGVMYPPAHPRCRCSVGLVYEKV